MPNMQWDALARRWVVAEAPQPAVPPAAPPPADWFRILDDGVAGNFDNQPARNQLNEYARALYDLPPGLVKRKRNIKPPAPPEIPAYEPPKDFDMTKPVYYMPYDTIEEINLRLSGSVIRLHGKAVYIVEAVAEGDPLQFTLWFKKNLHGDAYKHIYKEGSGFDLSPFKSRYIDSNGYAYWCYRKPVRGCYKQGACSKNTFMRMVGKEKDDGMSTSSFLSAHNSDVELVQVMDGIKKIRQQRDNGNAYFNAMLSPDVALVFKDRNYRVEYRGNNVGIFDVERNVLLADTPEITANIWAIRRLDAVGITLG